ncbi:MAG: hypothetical protein IT230_11990 [Flavobacteriales bacterium]|nr:hypothetical protein [Flavobacteriales bacterium]
MAGTLLACGYAALFLLLIRKLRFFQVPGLGNRAIGGLFLLKVAAGTALWAVYTYHYTDRSTADIFKFFDDGNVMFSALPDYPMDYLRMVTGIGNDAPRFDERYYSAMNNWYRRWDTGYYNDAHTMIRYSALVRIFSFGVYHVHTVFTAFLSLVGLVALYKTFIGFVPGLGRALACGLFLWPSVLFWGSAPIKEALLFFGLGLFLWQLFRRMDAPLPWHGWALLVLGLLVQLGLKSYVLACMVPGLAALWWCRRTNNRNPWLKYLAAHAAAAALVIAAPLLAPGLDVAAMVQQKQRDMLGVVAATHPGSFVPVDPMAPGLGGLIAELPHALYLTFLSPFNTWHLGAWGLLASLENLLLLAIIPLGAALAKPWRQVDMPLLLFCLAFCLLLGLLIGWTTPVVGALMRYRVPLLPFWSLACLLLIDPARTARCTKLLKP